MRPLGSNDLPRTASAVVIGGGAVGTSIAYALTVLGMRDVALLERGSIAHGATGRSAGLIRRHYTDRHDAALAQRSWEVFDRWAELVGGDIGFVKTGFLLIVRPEDVDALRYNVSMLASLGVDTRIVTPEQIREIDSSLSIDGVGAAAYEPGSGYADPTSVATEFARRARDSGATICAGVGATDIDVSGDRVVAVRTTHGPIATGTVVLASGAWAPAVARRAGVVLPIRTKRVVEIYVRRPASLRHVTVIDRVTGTYFRPEGRDVTLIGGRSDDWDVDPDDFEEGVGLDVVEPAIAKALARMPDLAGGTLMRGVAGVDGYTPDLHQVLGPVPGLAGLFVAAGGSGSAFKVSPAVGHCMAELICEGRARTVDLNPYRLTRFADGEPIRGEREYARAHEYAHV
jgi:sarcosine oxidase subunit beta